MYLYIHKEKSSLFTTQVKWKFCYTHSIGEAITRRKEYFFYDLHHHQHHFHPKDIKLHEKLEYK